MGVFSALAAAALTFGVINGVAYLLGKFYP